MRSALFWATDIAAGVLTFFALLLLTGSASEKDYVFSLLALCVVAAVMFVATFVLRYIQSRATESGSLTARTISRRSLSTVIVGVCVCFALPSLLSTVLGLFTGGPDSAQGGLRASELLAVIVVVGAVLVSAAWLPFRVPRLPKKA